ncbi:MAG: DUF2283 domain-containing protein [Lentisphaerae bacterium]|jgi:uncharacterized protein YuzE|nr:DUF2283 domain-containing protein [Lentisphaerota bacterium]
MRITHFTDTDTALLELNGSPPAETRELSEDIYLDLDKNGHAVSITIEHASQRSNFSEISFIRMGEPSLQQA